MGTECATGDCFPLDGGFAPELWDECRLAMSTASVGKARRFVVDRLDRWEFGQDVQDDVVLVVSELVTNAIVHTTSVEISCRLKITDVSVCVAIGDQGLDPVGPRVRMAPLAESGRGLQLVSILAEDWGVVRTEGDGRVVWASFRAPRPLRLA